MTTRVFISQPMSGLSELGIDQLRNRILLWLPRYLKEHDVIEIPKLSEWQAKSNTPVFNLGHSIQNMSRATIIVFAPGWEQARGCLVEHAVCESYHIPFIELEHDESGEFKAVRSEGYADS